MDRFTKDVIPNENTVDQAVALLVDALRNAADPLFLKSMNTLKSTGRRGRQMQDPGVQAIKKNNFMKQTIAIERTLAIQIEILW